MIGLENEITQFEQKYVCRELISKKLTSLSKYRNTKFLILIDDVISRLEKEDLVLDIGLHRHTIIKIIDELAEFVDIGDDLIESNINKEFFLKKMHKFITFPFRVQKQFVAIPNSNYNREILNFIDIVLSFELQIRNHNVQIHVLDDITELCRNRNCDFFLYFAMLRPFLRESKYREIEQFLNSYVIYDMILDDLCDVYEDFRQNSFNILLHMLEEGGIKVTKKRDLHALLKENEMFAKITEIGIKYCDKSLEELHNTTDLSAYFRFLGESARTALEIFQKYSYFESQEQMMQYSKIFKPYPWG